MSQIQGASAQYSMAWLFSVQQGGTASASPAPQGAGSPNATAFDPFSAMLAPGQDADAGSTPPFSLDAMSALLSAQEQTSGLSPDQQRVFSELDTDGDGKVTQSELETDFGADNKVLADAVMSKLDTNGDGSVDESEFGAGTHRTMRHRHGHHGGDGQAQGLDALMQATQAASTQTTSNSDGSTTTTLTYADGSTVTMTMPAASASTDNSTDQGSTRSRTQSNLLEQLIQLQAQLTNPVASGTTALTA
jgi:hypothetical protein